MDGFLRTMLACTLSMSAVALLLWIASPLIERRYSARGHYIAWLVVIAAFLVPWRPQLATPPIQVQVPAARVLSILGTPQTPAGDIAVNPPAPQTGPAQTATAAHEPAQHLPQITTWQLVGMLYLAGAAVSLGLRLRSHGRFLRAVRRWGRPMENPTCHAALREACWSLGICREVTLLHAPCVDSPMLTGLLRPRILLPNIDLPEEELSLVLRHELTHLVHGDLWGRLLLLLACTLHWFNPLLPLLARQLTLRSELACDAAVMRGMDVDTRLYYGETIIHSLRTTPTTTLTTEYYGGLQSMKKRIWSLFDLRRKRLGVAALSLLLCLSLGAGMALAVQTAPEADAQAMVALLAEESEYAYVQDYYPLLAEMIKSREVAPKSMNALLTTVCSPWPDEMNDDLYDEVHERAAWNLVSALETAIHNAPDGPATLLADMLSQDKTLDPQIKAALEQVLATAKATPDVASPDELMAGLPYDKSVVAAVGVALEDAEPGEPEEVRIMRALYALVELKEQQVADTVATSPDDIDAMWNAYIDYTYAVAKLHSMSYALLRAPADIVVDNWGWEIGRLIAVNDIYEANM